jgi:hypothetical protein
LRFLQEVRRYGGISSQLPRSLKKGPPETQIFSYNSVAKAYFMKVFTTETYPVKRCKALDISHQNLAVLLAVFSRPPPALNPSLERISVLAVALSFLL